MNLIEHPHEVHRLFNCWFCQAPLSRPFVVQVLLIRSDSLPLCEIIPALHRLIRLWWWEIVEFDWSCTGTATGIRIRSPTG